ncbi:MAG: pyridoxal phosphate-dependent aminotransferase [Rhodobacteraceae bacterium]|nr:pyridoxal phosphate-dependent aminotransferase [Paracoccaceae bacterium]
MNFDEIIERRGTHSNKWDTMESNYGVSPDDGLAMWVADMDFRSPDCVIKAARKLTDFGVFGYYGDYSDYNNAICWWMENRHGWRVEPDQIFTTLGLVNAIGMVLQAYTEPGDGVVIFTPVYHSFARVTKAAGRQVVECPLALNNGQYQMDFDRYDAQMTGREKIVILCSPHNPGGCVWTREELRQVASFCERHDLLLISDEIHHDLVFEGYNHLPMPLAAPEIADRLIMLTAPSKTFNVAGNHCGQVIIPDATLRARFQGLMKALSVSPTIYGVEMTRAAYSPEGAAWVDALRAYLEENARTLDAGIARIPGLKSMPLQSTFLSWVDFSGTGMEPREFTDRVLKTAKIAVNLGPTFGMGGENFLRFNIGCPRSMVDEAVSRLQDAFSDLQ